MSFPALPSEIDAWDDDLDARAVLRATAARLERGCGAGGGATIATTISPITMSIARRPPRARYAADLAARADPRQGDIDIDRPAGWISPREAAARFGVPVAHASSWASRRAGAGHRGACRIESRLWIDPLRFELWLMKRELAASMRRWGLA